MVSSHGNSFAPVEAVVVFLTRMAYPGTWSRLCALLGGRGASAYSRIFHVVLNHIYDTFNRCIDDVSRWSAHADEFAKAIELAGAPAPHCIGFIDGTIRPLSRPTEQQTLFYSGYKKVHCIKFQGVMGPNGLILELYGPIIGRRADGYMLGKSNFLDHMADLCLQANGAYYVYGDPAYALNIYVLRGLKGALTPAEQRFCALMNSLRVTVEWGFGLVLRDWAFVDFSKNLKLGKQPLGRLYVAAALLTNVKTCLTAAHALDGYGNAIAQMFGVPPPTAEQYLWG
jgi:hypothetical protein